MDVAVIGLKANSDSLKSAKVDMDKMSASAKTLEAAGLKLANAQDKHNAMLSKGPPKLQAMRSSLAAVATAEAQVARAKATHTRNLQLNEAALQANTSAANANAAATRAIGAASGAAAFRQRQLAVQSLDVAQSLALGMPPMMVAIQQGGQLAGIYAGQGGLTGAAKEATASVLRFARAHPAATAAVVATGIALAGLTHEINKTTSVSVGIGDVFMATMIVAKDAIMNSLLPAVAAISPFFSSVWGQVVTATKSDFNTVIGVAVGSYKFIVAEWDNLPAAFGDLSIQAANRFLKGIAFMLHKSTSAFNDFMLVIGETFNTKMPLLNNAFGDLGKGIENPFAGAANSNGGQQAFQDAMNFDYMGNAFSTIRDKAIELASANKEVSTTAAKAGKALTDAAEGAKDPWEGLRGTVGNVSDAVSESIQFARDVTGGFVSDLRNGLKQGEGFWDSFRKAASNALDKIADKLMNQVLNAIFSVNKASSGIGGGGGGILGGVFSLFGGGGFGNAAGLAMGGLFKNGGYTGDAGVDDVAGLVHGQEFVANAAATKRFRPQLEAMNRGMMPQMAGPSNQAVHVTVGLVNDGLNIAPEVRSISQSEASSAVSNYSRGSLARHAKNNAELTRRTG